MCPDPERQERQDGIGNSVNCYGRRGKIEYVTFGSDRDRSEVVAITRCALERRHIRMSLMTSKQEICYG